MRLLGFSGSIEPQSRLTAAVDLAVAIAAPGSASRSFDYRRYEPIFRAARYRIDLEDDALDVLRALEAAPALILGVPTPAGTIAGTFKHLFDLADREALRGKPTLVVTEGPSGGAGHGEALVRLTLETIGLSVLSPMVTVDRSGMTTDGRASRTLIRSLETAVAALRSREDRLAADGPARPTALIHDFIRYRGALM